MTQAAFEDLFNYVKSVVHHNPSLSDFAPWPENVEWHDRQHVSLDCLPEILALHDPSELTYRRLQDHIKAVVPHAEWRQSYTEGEVGREFLDHYGYFELVGPNGHFQCGEYCAFIGYWGPGLYYDWHIHRPKEIYLVINGGATFHTEGRHDQKLAHRGMMQFHASLEPHAMATGDEPILALVLWSGQEMDRPPRMLKRRRTWLQRIKPGFLSS